MSSPTYTLKAFIKDALNDLCEAVDEVRKDHPFVAPKTFASANNTDKATVVNFDVAITVSETNTENDSTKGKAGGGVKIAIFKAEAGVEGEQLSKNESANSQVSRIQFSVPVYFQYDENEKSRQEATAREFTRANRSRNERY